MKFKYCKNNCFDCPSDSTYWYHIYKCQCKYRVTIRTNLEINEFKLAAIIIDTMPDIGNLNGLLVFHVYKNQDLNIIHIKLDNNYILSLDYKSDDQYILDKITSYFENMIFE